jgi:uroporphyrin-3 C-methyltransferase
LDNGVATSTELEANAVKPAKSARSLAIFALLLALLAGTVSGYLWYLWDQDKQARLAESAQLDKRVKDTLDAVVQQREADLTELKSQLATQQGESETLRDEAEALQTRNVTQDKALQSIRNSMNNLQAEIKGLQGDITTLKGEVEIHKGGVEIQKADTQNLIAHVSSLQSDIRNLQDAQQKLEDNLETQGGETQIQKSTVQALQQEAKSLMENVQTLKEQLQSTIQERQKTLAEIDNRIQNLQLAQRNLLTTMDTVKAVAAKGGDVNALPLSEVEYLLRMANHKLNLQRDVAGAIEALQVANKRLGTLDEPAFSGVRQMIRENIVSLRGVELPDRSALAQKIVDMEERIDNLPLRDDAQVAELKEKVKPDFEVTETSSADSTSPWWQRASTQAWEQLKDIVIIRNERSSAAPLIAMEEKYFLMQNLRMELEAMRVALLGNNVTNYLISDSIAQKWVNTYFDTDTEEVQEFLAELETLKNIKLNPYIPDISNTLRAFQDVMERREPVRSISASAPAGSTEEAQP